MIRNTHSLQVRSLLISTVLTTLVLVGWFWPTFAKAAVLAITPDTGVYSIGDTFTARVIVNTQGATINAADARIRFNPQHVTVVGVSQANSIFTLWAEDPEIVGNEVVFSGGVPRGYTGTAGTIVTLTLRAVSAGTHRLQFQSGSVLAADGQGSNVLSSMNGSVYTVQARTQAPAPETVYVPAANTPGAPRLTSVTHSDPDGWSRNRLATIGWDLPAGVTQVRTALTQNPSSVPNQVADSLIREITYRDVPDGVSYVHVQFRNAEGWGAIARYRLAIATEGPGGLDVRLPEVADLSNPVQTLEISVATSVAPITRASVQIGGGEPENFSLTGATSTLTLPALPPGHHMIVVEVFDAAGNSAIKSLSFTIEAFAAPRLLDVPERINEGVIPAFRGSTRPEAEVMATIRSVANDTKQEFVVRADTEGGFQVIPEAGLRAGVYEISVRATDTHGAQSEASSPIRFVVEQPGFIRVGMWLVSVMSIIVPLLAMLVLTILGSWYILYRWRRLRRRVAVESAEAHQQLLAEFATLHSVLDEYTTALRSSRKSGQLTAAETALVEGVREQLTSAKARVEKEISDVEELVPRKNSPQNSDHTST